MLTEVQLEQLQRLSRKPRNKEVPAIVKELFLNHKVSQHEKIIDELDKPFEFKRYVRASRDSILSALKTIEALNQLHLSEDSVSKAYFELILALYQYQPSTDTKRHLELLVLHHVPASTVADVTNTSIQQLSRTLKQYNDKVKMIEDIRAHF
ncbi:hypothetical protein [Vibrio nigripulchritudo]|uniref:hypothetical protein n=1 Tax=Vibrio nigripulchritudo TaxID=28173 RepID=UPI00190D195F|nr:hypothetical protein [Vibrio nigripulchritudo]